MRAPGRTREAATTSTATRRAAIAAGAALTLLASATASAPTTSRPAPAADRAPAAAGALTLSGLFVPVAPQVTAITPVGRGSSIRPASRAVERKTRPAARPAAVKHRAGHRRVKPRTVHRRAAPLRSGSAAAMLAFAFRQLGEPYRWGAQGPGSWDCSGLTAAAAARAGIRLPHSAAAQGRRGRAVSRGDARAGDLVVWGNYHVGLYVGGGRVLHAPKRGDHVRVAEIWGNPRFRRLT